jgi:hypothetical protein
VLPRRVGSKSLVMSQSRLVPNTRRRRQFGRRSPTPWNHSGLPVEREREHDGPYFYSLGGHGFNSKERIDVRLEPKFPQIGLIDYNHSTETDFVRRIIASIDQEMVSTYGTTVDFIPRTNRWTDCLGP